MIEESNVDSINENANKDGKVIPTQRDLLAGIVAGNTGAKNSSICRRVISSKLTSVVTFTTTIQTNAHRSSQCLTVCLMI
ncbi:hypothetical protein O9929_25230 [Vibrio lentus]|nr:hypothetical protein [Vibrio lentus]